MLNSSYILSLLLIQVLCVIIVVYVLYGTTFLEYDESERTFPIIMSVF